MVDWDRWGERYRSIERDEHDCLIEEDGITYACEQEDENDD